MANSRLADRASFFAEVDLLSRGDTMPQRLWSQNLSEQGMFVQTTRPFAPGDRVSLRFDVDTNEVHVRVAEVMWIKRFEPINVDGSLPGVGLRFVSVDPPSRAAIRRYVTSLSPVDEEVPAPPAEPDVLPDGKYVSMISLRPLSLPPFDSNPPIEAAMPPPVLSQPPRRAHAHASAPPRPAPRPVTVEPAPSEALHARDESFSLEPASVLPSTVPPVSVLPTSVPPTTAPPVSVQEEADFAFDPFADDSVTQPDHPAEPRAIPTLEPMSAPHPAARAQQQAQPDPRDPFAPVFVDDDDDDDGHRPEEARLLDDGQDFEHPLAGWSFRLERPSSAEREAAERAEEEADAMPVISLPPFTFDSAPNPPAAAAPSAVTTPPVAAEPGPPPQHEQHESPEPSEPYELSAQRASVEQSPHVEEGPHVEQSEEQRWSFKSDPPHSASLPPSLDEEIYDTLPPERIAFLLGDPSIDDEAPVGVSRTSAPPSSSSFIVTNPPSPTARAEAPAPAHVQAQTPLSSALDVESERIDDAPPGRVIQPSLGDQPGATTSDPLDAAFFDGKLSVMDLPQSDVRGTSPARARKSRGAWAAGLLVAGAAVGAVIGYQPAADDVDAPVSVEVAEAVDAQAPRAVADAEAELFGSPEPTADPRAAAATNPPAPALAAAPAATSDKLPRKDDVAAPVAAAAPDSSAGQPAPAAQESTDTVALTNAEGANNNTDSNNTDSDDSVVAEYGRITLPLVGGKVARSFGLADPARVVVDLTEATFPGHTAIEVGDKGITRIRFGKPDPEHVRVVIELSGTREPTGISTLKRASSLAAAWR